MTTDTSSYAPCLLALTMGEPAGIGGELTLKAWLQRADHTIPFVVIDDPGRLSRVADKLGLSVPVQGITDPGQASKLFPDALPVMDLGMDISFESGVPSTTNSPAVCRSIEMAVSMAHQGLVQGIVTNPIQKKSLYDAGFEFPGHTEFIAHLSGNHSPVMMLASPDLRVVPISIHKPLATAIADINQAAIIECVLATAYALKHDFGIPDPQIAIAGLNPHAGEDGTLGDEEIEVIEPAIRFLKNEGVNVFGPVPPDALFTPRARRGYDVAMCHYHDQALIPIKALAVDEAVNITLGLTVVRTSPDHGTALDIAGKGIADPQSLVCALQMAQMIANNRAATKDSGVAGSD